ncbi:acyl carrier protein [Klebsiella pneumoniae]
MARHHDFFELGGDSLMATRMVAQLNRRGIAGLTFRICSAIRR